ncbi:MAG: FG-GAP repeat protein [Anaerolineaceae bacterium]|nr:FG-GAP repeat protein [Anaerolineaceae bacterium]
MRKAHLLLWVGLILALTLGGVAAVAQDDTPTPPVWDLRDTSQAGQFVFYDVPMGASTTGKPLDIGDFDADGCGDLAITGQNASPLGRGSAGHLRIVMSLCQISGQIVMDALEPRQRVISIYGAYPGDMAGTETYVADFNQDGYDDLLFSAQNNDGPDRFRHNAGAAYVLFGGLAFAVQQDIDLQAPPANLITIYGDNDEDRLGLWVEGGDFDGDGYPDILIGANQADGVDNRRVNAGEAWIIYGGATMLEDYGPVIDIRTPPRDATRIIGADFDDLLGSTVYGADFNNDTYEDVVVSAALWRASAGLGGNSFGGGDGPDNRRYNSGETFVIFGNAFLRGQTIDLATKIDETGRPKDNSITVVYGQGVNDLLGEEITAGDMDGDGQLDLLIGTLVGNGPDDNMNEAGEGWIIYTHEPFAGQMFDLANPDTTRTVAIYPDQPDSKGGDTMRAADLDGDGVDDLFYGAPNYDPTGADGRRRRNAGMMAVIFGEKGGMPSDGGRIILQNPLPEGLRVHYIIGIDDYDMMAYAMAIYDVNGDGVIDLAPNGMGGDGYNNTQINAGEVYVLDGVEFLSTSHVSGVETAPQPTVTPYPTPTPLPAITVTPSQAGDWERGQAYYGETCFACHGLNGEGIPNLGLPLVTSPLVGYSPDSELLAFLKEGRSADNPQNTTGVSMPPSGGRIDWDDQHLLDVIAYLRHLRDAYAAAQGQ